jgi:hypothetical protein
MRVGLADPGPAAAPVPARLPDNAQVFLSHHTKAKEHRMGRIEQRLQELGLVLPPPM